MVAAGLSIKLRCASWQQLATIYKRDLSRGTMFLKTATPPALGTKVNVDLALPSGSVISLAGTVAQQLNDPQRGAGVELRLDPLPSSSVWLIESALASEGKQARTTSPGVAPLAVDAPLADNAEVASAEQDLVRALVAEAESLKKLNPFLVLGVGYEASDADVRGAFGELTKRYHPDRFARYESPELRQVAAEIFILIRDAYRKLGDEASRSQALAALGKTSAPRAVAGKVGSPPPIPSIVRPGQPARPGLPRAATDAGANATAAIPPRVMVRATTEPGVRLGGAAPIATQRTSGPVPLVSTGATSGPVATIPAVQPKPTPPAGTPVIAKPTPASGTPIAPTPTPTLAPAEPPTASGLDGVTTLAPNRQSSPRVVPPFRPRTVGAPKLDDASEPTPAAADAAVPRREISVAQPPPPPPLADTGLPVLAQPPAATALAEAGDHSAIDDMIDSGRIDEALSAYKLLAKKHPADRGFRAGIELCEGLRALGVRDRLEAAQRFEAALEIDPSSERAARELAEMRRQATNERKGLLSRLMGKKEA